MISNRLFRSARHLAILLGVVAGSLNAAQAQDVQTLQTAKAPLVLSGQGSFYVNGDVVNQTAIETGLGIEGHSVINQMYVQYMKPQHATKVPVIMVHGGTLSGKTWDTTPDGRMGWYEYFVRNDHDVYVVDESSVGRAGLNQAIYNDVRAGLAPPSSQPNMTRVVPEYAWVGFRFGPTLNVPFADTQFPVNSAGEFLKQDIPLLGVAANSNYQALSDLAVKLNGAVVMGHSQGGRHPLEAALINPAGMRGLIVMEPAGSGCNSTVYTDQQIRTLATIPILVVYGDHLDQQAPIPVLLPQVRFNDCQAFIARINNVGGNAKMLWPPALGIKGNSHMLMFDKNNLQIADLIMSWIDKNVRVPGHVWAK